MGQPIRYLGVSFFYGRAFANNVDVNEQAARWVDGTANVRQHGVNAGRELSYCAEVEVPGLPAGRTGHTSYLYRDPGGASQAVTPLIIRQSPSEQADEAEFAEDPLVVVELRVRIPLLPHHQDPRAEAPHGERPMVDVDSWAPRPVVARPVARHPGSPVALVVRPVHGAGTPRCEAPRQRRRRAEPYPLRRLALIWQFGIRVRPRMDLARQRHGTDDCEHESGNVAPDPSYPPSKAYRTLSVGAGRHCGDGERGGPGRRIGPVIRAGSGGRSRQWRRPGPDATESGARSATGRNPAGRGLREVRETLDLLARSLRNEALVVIMPDDGFTMTRELWFRPLKTAAPMRVAVHRRVRLYVTLGEVGHRRHGGRLPAGYRVLASPDAADRRARPLAHLSGGDHAVLAERHPPDAGGAPALREVGLAPRCVGPDPDA